MSLRNANRRRMREVLFIPSGSIGDALMMIVLAEEIHIHNTEVQVTVLARRNARLIQDLAGSYPFIRVISLGKGLEAAWKLLHHSLSRPYTVLMPAVFGGGRAISLKTLFYILRFRPGTYSSGLLRDGEPAPYNAALQYDSSLLHLDNMRRMAEHASLPVAAIGSAFPVFKVKDIPVPILGDEPCIVIHPFGSSSWKSWPPRRTRELAEYLQVRYKEHTIVITGGPENAAEAQSLAHNLPKAVAFTGAPILEVASLLLRSDLYIGVDTGITHLACLMQVPSLLLEHNASPEWSPRYNPNATILTEKVHCECQGRKNQACRAEVDGRSYHRCLVEISDAKIQETVAMILTKRDATMGES